MDTQVCINAYDKYKNLKLAATKIGIDWHKLYAILKKEGVKVTGDKAKYGSETDKLAAKGEKIFNDLVPVAIDLNKEEYQSKIDFDVLGYGVDVKTSNLNKSNAKAKSRRWAFSVKKQELTADFFVGIALENEQLTKVYLIPCEIAKHYQTISVSENGSKWDDYLIEPTELLDFFKSLPIKNLCTKHHSINGV